MARKMKDSGIEWIGEIPEGWEIKYFVQLFSQVKSKNIGLREKNLLSLSYGKIKQKSIETVGGLLPDNFEGYNIIDRNDIVLRLTDLQNDQHSLRVGLSHERGIITSAYCSIRVRGAESPNYLYYYLHTFDIAKGFYGMGSGVRQGLNWDGLKYIKILLPPQHEQDRISVFLNQKTLEIDSMLSKTISSIEEYKKLKQAVITQAVTKGVRGEREMKGSGVEWIGEIPKEWGRTKIKMIASFFNGDRTSRYPQPSDFVDSGVAFLTSRNIDSDEVDLSETKYITDDKYKSLSGAKIQIDDIIFCLRGSVGKCAINRTLSCGTVASSLATIRPKDIYPEYLLYFLLSNIASTQTTIFMNGTCAANLSAESVGNYYITLPISAEQKEIANYLDAKCAEIDGLIAKKEQLVKELESYKKSLIYEVVTGKREV